MREREKENLIPREIVSMKQMIQDKKKHIHIHACRDHEETKEKEKRKNRHECRFFSREGNHDVAAKKKDVIKKTINK